MNEDVIADLKQFIATAMSQQFTEFEERFEKKMDVKLDAKLGALEQKLTKQIHELSEFVTEAIDTSNDTHGVQLADHERRLTKLEQATA